MDSLVSAQPDPLNTEEANEQPESPEVEQAEPAAPKVYLFADLDEESRKERLDWLGKRCIQRITDCRTDLGLPYGIETPMAGTWAHDRHIALAHYNNDFSDRVKGDNVFSENNWSLNSLEHCANMTAAQVNGDLVSTEPFMACMPEKPGPDEKLAKALEAKIQRDLGLSNIQQVLAESVRIAMALGERPIKLSYEVDETTFFGPATVAVDPQGAPIVTPSGLYIYPKDNWIADPSVQNQMRLEKDPRYVDILQPGTDAQGQPVMKSTLRYVELPRIPQTITHFKGVKAFGMHYADFLFPRNIPHLSKADFMCHVYDADKDELQRKYSYLQDIAKLPAGSAMSGENQPNQQAGERMVASGNNYVHCHECYIRCDADEDGKEEWIFALMDYQTQQVIYSEYLGNMKMKRPPFALLRGIRSVPNRAYGAGVYTIARDTELFVDVTFNRAALKDSKKGSLTFVYEDEILEIKDGNKLMIGSKEIYTLPKNSQRTASNPPAFRINLNELSDGQLELMEKAQQALVLRFGVVSAADGSASDLNASDTKYGIQNIERTGNLLMRGTEEMVAKDIEELLDLFVDIDLENMDEQEPSVIQDEAELAMLNRDEIRVMERNVRLLLTKVKSSDQVQVSTQVVAILKDWVNSPPSVRKIIRTPYISILRGYEVQDADDILAEPTPQEIDAYNKSQAVTPPPKNLAESLAIKFGDLPPKVQFAAVMQLPGMSKVGLTLEDFIPVPEETEPTKQPLSPTTQQPPETPIP